MVSKLWLMNFGVILPLTLDAYLFGQTPARNFSNLLGKILKFMLEMRQGSEVLQISRVSKVHFVHSTKCPYALFM